MADRMAATTTRAREDQASSYSRSNLGSRLFAYFIDSLLLFGFSSIFWLAAFLNIFLRSDSGKETPSDSAIWNSVLIIMMIAPAWLLVNLFFAMRRAQTGGQYVAGLGIVTEKEAVPGAGRLLLYWLALHPLLYHPLLAGFWGLFTYTTLSLSESNVLFFFGGTLTLLCLLAPLANLFFAVVDPAHRTIHDRLAGMKVVRVA